jgi:hypothetical protein
MGYCRLHHTVADRRRPLLRNRGAAPEASPGSYRCGRESCGADSPAVACCSSAPAGQRRGPRLPRARGRAHRTPALAHDRSAIAESRCGPRAAGRCGDANRLTDRMGQPTQRAHQAADRSVCFTPLTDGAVDVVDAVDSTYRVQHMVEISRIAHLETEAGDSDPVPRGLYGGGENIDL